ncbi:MAG TPA: hypothetical protein DHV12_09680 [Thermotogae bacterium]|nr:hypothetical protein [Thermotogota bacterium]HCZ07377.1 hypothetical protein [Thermotogota bacterium]
MKNTERILAITVGKSLYDHYSNRRNDLIEEFQEASVEEIIRRVLDNRGNRDENKEYSVCAELETLYLYLNESSKNIEKVEKKYDTNYHVYLLYVENSKEGKIVAEKIKDLIGFLKTTYTELKKVEKVVLRGFKFDVSSKEEASPDDLYKALLDLKDKYREIAIIGSGGYKILAVYAGFFGMLFRIPVYYKFEKFDELIDFKPLPLYWDIRELEYHITRLRSQAKPGTLYSFLGNNIDAIREETLYSEPLLNTVMPDGKLKSLLKENLPFWMNQWIGDQVPEMVEHSKRHSRRLLEKFEFLNEGGIFSPDFCENEEVFYFLLIASAYLHDIGHTMIEYKGLQLQAFPEILRKYHHILSKKFLENHRDEMGLGTLNEELFTALKLICMYHRKDMFLANPLKNIKETDRIFFRYFDEEVVPMNNHPEFKNLPEQIQRITLKVAALLKLLDEMDVQADRIVDEHYKDARNFRTNLEIDHLQSKLEELKKSLSVEDISGDLNEICQRFSCNKLADLSEPVILAHSLANRIEFKKKQKDHFKKHSSIRAVVPQLGSDGTLVIRIHSDGDIGKVKDDLEDQKCFLKKDEEVLKKNEEFLDLTLFPFSLDKMRIEISA